MKQINHQQVHQVLVDPAEASIGSFLLLSSALYFQPPSAVATHLFSFSRCRQSPHMWFQKSNWCLNNYIQNTFASFVRRGSVWTSRRRAATDCSCTSAAPTSGAILLWSDLTDAKRHEYDARAAKLERLQDVIRDASAWVGRRPRKAPKPRPKRPKSKKPGRPAKKKVEAAPPASGSDINCLRLRNSTLPKRPVTICKPEE